MTGTHTSGAGPTVGVPLAEVTRRDERSGRELVESVHLGHAVLTGPDGEVLAAVGDPSLPTYVRSAAKPLQATACLEVLGDSRRPSPPELAVGWASHRGEARHVDAVRDLLHRSGTTPEQLTCPPASPQADPGATPARILHNCSGKHALFALAGAQQGTDRAGLLDPDGPLQRLVLARLADGLGPLLAVAVDGCGAPAVAVELAGLARAFGRIAVDDDHRPVREAGFAHPGLVGGEGRLESALLGAGVVAKVGAEGVYGVGWQAADGSPRGFAVKATDGATRGVAALTVALLTALGVVPADVWVAPPPLGGGEPVGAVRATATALDRLAAAGS
ncbi:asparaginase [Egicoccus halophilus]|uniref:Asparaginase n=1 Tax=Egicoccus halophilus TaxID=1670830 RepID=A0A8J3A939_9ACTN|nr:asparaginase [Egicoccus halophilus]GGI07618.1 asparaginase [Egicoccus halophilus]